VHAVGGRVDERMISEGDFIGIGEPTFRIAPTDRFRVRLSFPERVSDRLQVGQEARLGVPARPGSNVDGVLARLRPQVEGGTQAMQALIEFENPGTWRAGMTVSAEVIVASREDAVTVPRTSVVDRPGRRVVYVIDGDHAREREVEIGARTAQWLEIRTGLDGGEIVAVDGASFLTDGARIRVREGG
jgi:RND family efflux transporter MFP subunit